MHAPGSTTAGGAASASVPVATTSRSRGRSRQRLNPTSATANDSSGAPPSWTIGSIGPSVWPNATTPHGNPPNGTRRLEPLLGRPQPGEPDRPAGQPPDRHGGQAPNSCGKHRLERATARSTGPSRQVRRSTAAAVGRTPARTGSRIRIRRRSVVDSRVSTHASNANATIAMYHQPNGGKLTHSRHPGDDRDAQLRQPVDDRLAEPLSRVDRAVRDGRRLVLSVSSAVVVDGGATCVVSHG